MVKVEKLKIRPEKRWWPFSYTFSENGIFLDKRIYDLQVTIYDFGSKETNLSFVILSDSEGPCWRTAGKLTKSIMKGQHFFVYIITNPNKIVLYTGVTNDLADRLQQHFQNRGDKTSFAGKYNCYQLLYYETFSGIEQAISREKEIKGWTRAKKEALIATINPKWDFLKA